MQLRERYRRDGYVIVPGVFSPPQIADLRRELLTIFDKPPAFPGDLPKRPNGAALRFEVPSRYEALRWLLVHPPLLAAVRELRGDDCVFLPEMSAHDSGYGGWHKDTTSQESVGHRFHWDRDFDMLEVAIYMQDNDRIYGGGLEVIPRSHREPDRYVDRAHSLIDRVKIRADQVVRGKRVASKAGDLVLFHFRLDHRASQPLPRVPVPADKRKLAIFFAASANNAHAKRYRDFIASRQDYVYLHGEHSYPQELLALTNAAGVSLLP